MKFSLNLKAAIELHKKFKFEFCSAEDSAQHGADIPVDGLMTTVGSLFQLYVYEIKSGVACTIQSEDDLFSRFEYTTYEELEDNLTRMVNAIESREPFFDLLEELEFSVDM